MPVIENGDGRQHDKKALYHCCALGVIAAADGALYYIFPGPGLHSFGIDAQLFSVLLCTSRHDNDRIERGIQGTGGRWVLPCRRCVTAEPEPETDRQRRLEMAPEVKLPRRGWSDTDRGRGRLLRRYGRQLLRAECRHRPEALGSGSRRRDWRRRDHVYRGGAEVAVAAGFSMVAWPRSPCTPRSSCWASTAPPRNSEEAVMELGPVFLLRLQFADTVRVDPPRRRAAPPGFWNSGRTRTFGGQVFV